MGATHPAPSDGWIEGDFEGVYAGDRLGSGGVRDARRFAFELQSGTLTNVEVVEGPAPEEGEPDAGEAAVRQDRVRRVRLPPDVAGQATERPLFDVRIRDYRLRHPAEIKGRAYGTIVGRLRARLAPEPPPLGRTAPQQPLPEPELAPEAPPESEALPAIVDAPPPAQRSHGAVADPDARLLLARLRWVAALSAWLLVTALFARLCGASMAALFAAPLGVAMLLHAAARRFATSPPPVQAWLGIGLVVGQAGLLAGDYAAWWQGVCRGLPAIAALWLSAPTVVAGLLRLRWPLVVTGLLWTGVLCTWCVAGDCVPGSTLAKSAGVGPAGLGAGAGGAGAPLGGDRTDADGRWPKGLGLPALRGLLSGEPGASGDLVAEPGAGGGDVVIESGPRHGGDRVRRIEAGGPRPAVTMPGDGLQTGTDGVPMVPGHAPPGGRVASVPGGWVAPEDGERDLTRISVEYANRNPEAFFGAAGSRRVYLQTDPVFEAGGSRMRAKGPFELTRLANLLRWSPGQPVVIEVHTDSGGGPQEQLARGRRRAEAVAGFLVNRGHLDSSQFQVVSAGGGDPIVPPDGSYAAQAPNRRLEVRLADTSAHPAPGG